MTCQEASAATTATMSRSATRNMGLAPRQFLSDRRETLIDFKSPLRVVDPGLRHAPRRGRQAVEFLDGLAQPVGGEVVLGALDDALGRVAGARLADDDPLRQRRLDAAPEAGAGLALARGANDLEIEPFELFAQLDARRRAGARKRGERGDVGIVRQELDERGVRLLEGAGRTRGFGG